MQICQLCYGMLFVSCRRRGWFALDLGHCTAFKMLSSFMVSVLHPFLILQLYSRANGPRNCTPSPFSLSLRQSSASAPTGVMLLLTRWPFGSPAIFHVPLRAPESPFCIPITTPTAKRGSKARTHMFYLPKYALKNVILVQLQHIGSELHCTAISFKSIKFRIRYQFSLLTFPLKLQNIVLPTSSEAEEPEVTSLITCFRCLFFPSLFSTHFFPRTGRVVFCFLS